MNPENIIYTVNNNQNYEAVVQVEQNLVTEPIAVVEPNITVEPLAEAVVPNTIVEPVVEPVVEPNNIVQENVVAEPNIVVVENDTTETTIVDKPAPKIKPKRANKTLEVKLSEEQQIKYSRQSSVVPSKIFDKRVCVVGCGAVGRNVILQLVSMGVSELSIFDFDKVEIHNVSSQGFLHSDIGSNKVDAVINFCRNINPSCKITGKNDVWRPDFKDYDYVFLCADDMVARKNISRYYHNIKNKPIVIDTRMSGETIRTLVTWNRQTRSHYNKSLFSNNQATDGNCTSSTTIYCANVAAATAIQAMVNHLKRIPVERDTLFNMGTGIRFTY